MERNQKKQHQKKSLHEAFQDMVEEYVGEIDFSNAMFRLYYTDESTSLSEAPKYTVLQDESNSDSAMEALQEFFQGFCEENGLKEAEVDHITYAGPDPECFSKAEKQLAAHLGITTERYLQMRNVWQDVGGIKEAVGDWGVEAINKGYAIFDHDGTGLLEISAIDAVGAFDDEEAAHRAANDGIKIIPVKELPDNMPEGLRYYGWVDTPENRKAIRDYCDKYGEAEAEPDTGNALVTLLVNLGFADEVQEHILFQVPGNRLQEAKEQVQKGKEAYDALPSDNFQTLEDCIEECFKRECIPYSIPGFDVMGIQMDA